jgi:hypothetical protein
MQREAGAVRRTTSVLQTFQPMSPPLVLRHPGWIALGYAALLSAALSLASSSLESEVFSTRGL